MAIEKQRLWIGRCGLTVDGANFSLCRVCIEPDLVKLDIPLLFLPLALILGVRRNTGSGWTLNPAELKVHVEPGIATRSVTLRSRLPGIPDEYLVFPSPGCVASLLEALASSGALVEQS